MARPPDPIALPTKSMDIGSGLGSATTPNNSILGLVAELNAFGFGWAALFNAIRSGILATPKTLWI